MSDISLSRECAQHKRFSLIKNDWPPFEGSKKPISKPKSK